MKTINFVYLRSMNCKYSKLLKRARYLYVLLCRPALKKNSSLIEIMAERGSDRGLWSANGPIKDVRWSIMNTMFKQDQNKGIAHWKHQSTWMRENGFRYEHCSIVPQQTNCEEC